MTFIFPNSWSKGKETFYIDSETCQQLTARTNTSNEVVSKKTNPFPGYLSTIQFPLRVTKVLWSIRASFNKHWVLRCVLHGKRFSWSTCPYSPLSRTVLPALVQISCYMLVLMSTRRGQPKRESSLEQYDWLRHWLRCHTLLHNSRESVVDHESDGLWFRLWSHASDIANNLWNRIPCSSRPIYLRYCHGFLYPDDGNRC